MIKVIENIKKFIKENIKGIIKFFVLKALEISAVIFVPYWLSMACRECFNKTTNNLFIWAEGWLVIAVMLLCLAIVLFVVIVLLIFAMFLFMGILVWINWNWRLATGRNRYEKNGTLGCVDWLYERVEWVLGKINFI